MCMIYSPSSCTLSILIQSYCIIFYTFAFKGWFFLSCKFERIIYSEPLSVVASAFDDFLQHCLGNLRHKQIRVHLDKLMQPEEIAALVKHVPSLLKYADHSTVKPNGDFEVNTEQMHYLFSQLLRAL